MYALSDWRKNWIASRIAAAVANIKAIPIERWQKKVPAMFKLRKTPQKPASILMDFNFEFFIILFDDSMKCVNIATGRYINKNKRRILFAELYVHLKRSPSGLSLGQMSPMPTLSIRFMAIRHYKQLNHHFNVFVIIRFVDVDFVILTIQCVCNMFGWHWRSVNPNAVYVPYVQSRMCGRHSVLHRVRDWKFWKENLK